MGRSKRPGRNVRAAGGRSTRHYYSGRHSRVRRLPLMLIALLFLFAGTAAVLNAMRSHAAAGAGYWHTSGTEILDENNHHVRIAGVTWYGMESSYWVPAGLDYQPYTRIMDLVKSLGYNAIRLPFSNELVETNPIVTDKIAANPQFKGMHALGVMDAIVQYAHKISLKIILDDHRCHASRPSNVNLLDEPLWYTPQYPESAWIDDWVSLARRYQNDDAVIGFDLRNEPHTDGPGPWTIQTYENQGATWGPTDGVDNPATDWRLAAERGGNAVLAVNPRLLMFVEGVQLYPDATKPGGMDAYWWGSILTGVRTYPVVFNVPHQLVYSPHDWGPWKWNFPWFPHMTYASMQKVWHDHWSFIAEDSNASYAAPLWIGEFGTCTNNPKCLNVQRPGNQATWFQYFLRYLRDNPNVGWSFFALNGSNSNDHAAWNGITDPHWSTTASAKLQSYLAGVQG
jgi:endoglucanase